MGLQLFINAASDSWVLSIPSQMLHGEALYSPVEYCVLKSLCKVLNIFCESTNQYKSHGYISHDIEYQMLHIIHSSVPDQNHWYSTKIVCQVQQKGLRNPSGLMGPESHTSNQVICNVHMDQNCKTI